MKIQQGKSDLAMGSMGRMQDAVSKPFDWGSVQKGAGVPQAGALQNSINMTGMPAFQGGSGGWSGKIDGGPTGKIDLSKLGERGALVDQSKLGAWGQGVDSSVGDQSRQRYETMLQDRLRPEQDRQREKMDMKLQNQGLTPGSAAYNRAMQSMGDQQSRDQLNVFEQGGREQRNQFDMAMGGSQLANAMRGQGLQEQLSTSGQMDSQRAAGLNEQGVEQGMINQANQLRQQAQTSTGSLANQSAGIANQGAQIANQARAQAFNEQMGMAGLFNQMQGQQFGQDMQSANYQNNLRQQQIAEQQMQRNQPLNEMNAILSGQQVGMPTMPSFNASQSSGGTNYSGAAGQTYNASTDAYNAKQAQAQGLMSGIGGLASTAMMFSDRRLKSNIVKVGEHPIGVSIYEYDIFGRRERGVMAQELMLVAPERVNRHTSGFLTVDYRGL